MDKVLTFSIAAYNVEKTIEETLKSLVCDYDTMRRMEVLVIDDGSSDYTYDRVAPFLHEYSGTFSYVKKENGGHGSTLTYGLSHAKGKYFRMLDGDDLVFTEELPRYVEYLKESKADVVVSPFVEFYEGGKEEVVDRHKITPNGVVPIDTTVELLSHEFAVRTDLLNDKDIKIEEHCVYTDVEYCFYATLYSDTIQKYINPIYRYRKGVEGQTVSDAGRRKHPDDPQRILLKMLREQRVRGDIYLNPEKLRIIYCLYDNILNLGVGNIFDICRYSEKEKCEKFVGLCEEINSYDKSYLIRYFNDNREGLAYHYLLYTLPKVKKYIVWGTGKYGELAISIITELYDGDVIVADGNPDKWGNVISDRVIISPEEALQIKEEDYVIIAAMKYGGEKVKDYCESKKIRADKVLYLK